MREALYSRETVPPNYKMRFTLMTLYHFGTMTQILQWAGDLEFILAQQYDSKTWTKKKERKIKFYVTKYIFSVRYLCVAYLSIETEAWNVCISFESSPCSRKFYATDVDYVSLRIVCPTSSKFVSAWLYEQIVRSTYPVIVHAGILSSSRVSPSCDENRCMNLIYYFSLGQKWFQ